MTRPFPSLPEGSITPCGFPNPAFAYLFLTVKVRALSAASALPTASVAPPVPPSIVEPSAFSGALMADPGGSGSVGSLKPLHGSVT
jgi:hypothetical protein